MVDCKQDENSPQSNQMLSDGGVNEMTPRALMLDETSLRRLIAINEPFAHNWRGQSPLYEGRATRWFHVWPSGEGFGVYAVGSVVIEDLDEADAISVMGQLHDLYEREIFDMVHKLKDAYVEARDTAICYFIGAEHGPIKIGVSRHLESRLRDLQCASPYRLAILASVDGGFVSERRFHAKFAAHRLQGEWFDRHPDILAEISRLTEGTTHGY